MLRAFALLISFVVGAAFNEWATEKRHQGYRDALEVASHRMIEEYTSFALRMAELEAWRKLVCSDALAYRETAVIARRMNIELCP